MAAGRGSRQWVTSHPTERMDLEGHGGYDFRITITTYLGRECPVARGLARDGVVLAGAGAGRPGRGRPQRQLGGVAGGGAGGGIGGARAGDGPPGARARAR